MADDADGNGRRPRRRAAAKHAVNRAMPSAVHYVGYVEDDETPEMIMRKFEELEKIKQQQEQPVPAVQNDAEPMQVDAEGAPQGDTEGPGGPAGGPAGDSVEIGQPAVPSGGRLTEEQLLQVFKQTSMFNVRTALQNNDVLLDSFAGDMGGYSEDDMWSDEDTNADYLAGFWSDEDGSSFAQHWRDLRKKKKGERGPRGLKGDRGAPGRARHVMHYNAASQAFIRRKVKAVDDDAILQLRIPPHPIPLAWGRNVMPYIPRHLYCTEAYPATVRGDMEGPADLAPAEGPAGAPAPSCNYHQVPCIAKVPASDLQKTQYLGVLINRGWEAPVQPGKGDPDVQVVKNLTNLQLNRACPTGFFFIWVDKQHISAVVDLMYKWKFTYVENLNWLQLAANNQLLALDAEYFARSHLTLFIFRKEGAGKDIELRHQRNPDIIFDCIQAAEGTATSVPAETYVAIETLLPTGKGRFLELWAPKGQRRTGWTHYVEAADA